MIFIYVLELEKNKFYIGKTANPNFRLEQHFNSGGAAWTKKYKPINVLELISDCDNFDEDKYTLKYMEKYGINNVRGGSFCEIKLNDNNLITLHQIINSVTDKCYICGNKGHYANDCKKESSKQEQIPIIILNEKCDCITSYFKNHRRDKCLLNNIFLYFYNEDEDIDKLTQLQDEAPNITQPNIIQPTIHRNNTREGPENVQEILDRIKNIQQKNNIALQFVKKQTEDIDKLTQLQDEAPNIKEDSDKLTKIQEKEEKEESNKVFYCNYCNKEFDTLKGVTCHKNLYCKNNKLKNNKVVNETNVCYRCGREGHYINDCYASKHINGKYLK